MRAVDFEGSNAVLGPPAGWSEREWGRCDRLPLAVSEDGLCVSYWEPSPSEREAIARGARVVLRVLRPNGHPPVMLAVEGVEG